MTTTAEIDFQQAVREFAAFGRACVERETLGVPTYVNEFWTAKQRQGHTLHEVSYRACFKPQLPAFFIDRLTQHGDAVYDPFAGRGTTALEAALRGRRPFSNDINPLSGCFLAPRLRPPTLEAVAMRLDEIDLSYRVPLPDDLRDDLLTFFHPETLTEIAALRAYLLSRVQRGHLDEVDAWIRMVALNRLTGHSSGFFSVYTLPPNQAVTATAQRAINARRDQAPSARPIAERILRKSRSLLRGLSDDDRAVLAGVADGAQACVGPADRTALADGSVDLVVTSPPFLDVVDYATDNWLRCWFCGIDPDDVSLTQSKGVEAWQAAMQAVFSDLFRVVRPGGHVAFEVGEVRNGKVLLEEYAIPAAQAAGFEPLLVMINDQKFTKTANCWGVSNQVKGTNTNRICVFQRAQRAIRGAPSSLRAP